MNQITSFNPNPETPATLYNVEAEQQLLGALLLEPSRVDLLGGAIDEADFFDPVYGALFERIRMRWKMNRPVSVFALKDWAADHPGMKELGGPNHLAKLAGASISGFDFKGYANIVRGLAEKRRLRQQLQEAADSLTQDDVSAAEAAGRIEVALMERGAADPAAKPVSMMKAVTLSLERMHAAQSGEPTGEIPSGIPALDKLIGGFNPGQLWIIAGRPSMGKSALAVTIGTRLAAAGHGVCINSREMMAQEIADRVISERTALAGNGNAVVYKNFAKGGLADYQVGAVVDAAREVSTLPLYTLDSAGYSDVGSTLAGARHVQTLLGPNVGLKALIIDYIGLMKGRRSREGRQFEVAEISQDLKALAKRLEIPVICLAQLNRQVEQREDKRPMLSDLRDSGQIEQDADGVIFCYRDEYYLERQKESYVKKDMLEVWQTAMEAVRNKLELIVAKQRQGPVGTAHVRMNPALNHIWE